MCPSKIVLKIDDDVMINMYLLLSKFLPALTNHSRSVLCFYYPSHLQEIMREGKWKVASHQFNSVSKFPYGFCAGMTVLFTTDLMQPLYEVSKHTPFFWIDDIFLYGILPAIVGDIKFLPHRKLGYFAFYNKNAKKCLEEKGRKCMVLTCEINSDKQFFEHWESIRYIYRYLITNSKRPLI